MCARVSLEQVPRSGPVGSNLLENFDKSKGHKDVNVRLETIQLLEENIGRTLFDIK